MVSHLRTSEKGEREREHILIFSSNLITITILFGITLGEQSINIFISTLKQNSMQVSHYKQFQGNISQLHDINSNQI